MPPLPHQRRKTARPDELLEAALALFVERGFAATRIDDVAQRAGVSKGTVYLYWSSKEDLLRNVIQRFLGDHLDHGEELLARHDGTVVDLLRTRYVEWWTDVLESPAAGVFKLMLAEARNFPDVAQFYQREVVERGRGMILRLLEHGVARGEIRPLDPDQAAFSLLMPMVMLCVHRHSLDLCWPAGGPDHSQAMVRGHVELLLQGLLADEAPSKITVSVADAGAHAPGGT